MSSTARSTTDRDVLHDACNPPVSSSNQNTSILSSHMDMNAESTAGNLAWHLSGEYTGPVESVLPREFRQRLHKHFARIEREFEREYRRLYGENLALQERLEKFEDTEHSEGPTLAKKLGASLLSQRLKQQYKQSASRLVSSLRQSAGHSGNAAALGAHLVVNSAQAGSVNAVTGGAGGGSVAGTGLVGTATLWQPPSVSTQSSTTVFAGTLAGHGSSWQLVNRVCGHRDGIWEVTSHRRFLATASADNTVRLWTNNAQMNCLMVYLGHYGSANSVRFRNRDHLMLTSSGDGTAHLIRLPFDLLMKATNCLNSASQNAGSSTNAVVAAFEAASSALTSEFAGSGGMGLGIGTGSSVKAATIGGTSFDTEDVLLPNTEIPEDTAGSPIRASTVLGTTIPIYVRHPHAIFQSANLSGTGSTMPGGNSLHSSSCIDSSPLSAADFLTGREQMVTAGWDRLGRIYDLGTGQEVSALTGHDHQLTDVRCAPDGAPLVVTSSRDCTFRLWDFRQPGMRVHVQQAHNQTVSTTQFLTGSTNERLISAGADRLCRIWDLRQSRGPLVTIRTDSGINRLSISGSSVNFTNLLTGDVTLESATASAAPPAGMVSAAGTGTTVPSSAASTTAAPTAEGSISLLNSAAQTMGITASGANSGFTNTASPGLCSSAGINSYAPSALSSWATSTLRILALPLENRGIKFFDLNGNRVGRITRSSSRGHARMVTSVAWADEGLCNFFSTGFDCRLLAWQIHLGNQ